VLRRGIPPWKDVVRDILGRRSVEQQVEQRLANRLACSLFARRDRRKRIDQ
jgi:hypothetical protein